MAVTNRVLFEKLLLAIKKSRLSPNVSRRFTSEIKSVLQSRHIPLRIDVSSMRRDFRLVGIAGYSGSGAATVARLYEATASNVASVCLWESVKAEVQDMGLPADTNLLRFVFDYRNKTAGNQYWIDRAISRDCNGAGVVVIHRICNLGQAGCVRQFGGLIVWVDADEQDRRTRIRERESKEVLEEIDESSEVLSGLKETADYIVVNRGTMDELRASIASLTTFVNDRYTKSNGNLGLLAVSDAFQYDVETSWCDEISGLQTLEKKAFFERFVGGIDSAIKRPSASITPEMSLKEVVNILWKPNLRSISGNQTARRIGSIFEESDPRAALTRLRSMMPSNQEEEYFTTLTDTEFFNMHIRAHAGWMNSRGEIFAVLPQRIREIQKTDEYQFGGQKDRSLSRMRRDGLVLSVDTQDRDKIKQLGDNPLLSVRPLLEFVKNERIFNVSGFRGSKASLVVHDALDHLWTFDLLDRIGLIRKYEEMFDAIGNPEKLDIFRREGEAVASISYGVRAFEGVAPGFKALIGARQIVGFVQDMRGRLAERHTGALQIINNLESNGTEWRSLGYTFSNYITELDEQRRTYGSIKYRDPKTKRTTGELDPFSADYLCFFIEAHHALLDSANKHRNALFYIHFLIEEYLRAVSKTPDVKPISVTLALLDGISLRYSNAVPNEVSEWMFRNYSFTANRNLV